MSETYYIDTADDVDDEPVSAWIDGQLQRWFSGIVDEPLPEQFQRLLRRLNDEQRP